MIWGYKDLINEERLKVRAEIFSARVVDLCNGLGELQGRPVHALCDA